MDANPGLSPSQADVLARVTDRLLGRGEIEITAPMQFLKGQVVMYTPNGLGEVISFDVSRDFLVRPGHYALEELRDALTS